MNLKHFYTKEEGTNSMVLKKKMPTSSNKILFIDRDGVMIKDTGHISSLDEVSLCEGLNGLLSQFGNMGYRTCVVTNQSSVARKIITRYQYEAITERMLTLIREDLWPDYIMASFYHNAYSLTHDESNWRKPDTGMFEYIRSKNTIDVDKSLMIGDKLSDIKAGSRFGINNLVYIKSQLHASEEQKVRDWGKSNNKRVIYTKSLTQVAYKINY